ncbi:hypothetical protein V6N13_007802 [Hibiscus sabdariffa]
MHQSCKAAGAGSMSRVSDAKPNQGMRKAEGNLQVWPRPSATKGDKQRTGSAKAGRALRKMRESHFRGRHQGLAEGVKQPMEASGQTKARKGQGSIQHIPSRRKQECQCTGRARQQEQGAFPVYRTPNPIRGCVTRRETSKYGQGPAPQRATNNAPAAKAGRALRKTEEEPLTEISAKAALTIVTRG